MTRPIVLVIDDTAGWDEPGKGERKALCRDLGLSDVEAPTDVAMADAVFTSGQRRTGDRIENSVDVALDILAERWAGDPERRWALVLLDLNFSYGDVKPGRVSVENFPEDNSPEFGLRLLGEMQRRWPDPEQPERTAIPVVALSSQPRGNQERALRTLGIGDMYLERGSARPEQQRRNFAEALFRTGLLRDWEAPNLDAKKSSDPLLAPRSRKIVGASLALLRTLREARRHSRMAGEPPCLILGPSGVGKESLAHYIHEMSPRAKGNLSVVAPRNDNYVAFNCATLQDTMVEVELFGYGPDSAMVTADKKGKVGLWEQASEGTLFLDEFGTLPEKSQQAMLRSIQEKKVRRMTAEKEVGVNVRLIAATNEDLGKAMSAGAFRGDLLSRFGASTMALHMPMLRDRLDDIRPLFDFFLEDETAKATAKGGGRKQKTVDPQVYAALRQREWQAGNIRELEQVARNIANACLYASVIMEGDVRAAIREDTRTEGTPAKADQPQSIALENAFPTATEKDARPTIESPMLSEAVSALRRVNVSYWRADSRALADLEAATGDFWGRILEEALRRTCEVTGQPDAILAINMMLQRKLESPEAAHEICRLAERFESLGAGRPSVTAAVDWARSICAPPRDTSM